jgi:hypothetical protein
MVALLTVELPSTVKYDQEFQVVLRQVETRLAIVEQSVEMRRRVIGSFELRVPVQKAAALVEEEERKFAVLQYIQGAIPKDDPWAAVFQKYVAQVAERVDGFGGDSATIPASPNGAPRDQKGDQNCLLVAWHQLIEGLRSRDFARVFRAVRAGLRCIRSSARPKGIR